MGTAGQVLARGTQWGALTPVPFGSACPASPSAERALESTDPPPARLASLRFSSAQGVTLGHSPNFSAPVSTAGTAVFVRSQKQRLSPGYVSCPRHCCATCHTPRWGSSRAPQPHPVDERLLSSRPSPEHTPRPLLASRSLVPGLALSPTPTPVLVCLTSRRIGDTCRLWPQPHPPPGSRRALHRLFLKAACSWRPPEYAPQAGAGAVCPTLHQASESPGCMSCTVGKDTGGNLPVCSQAMLQVCGNPALRTSTC